MHGAFAADANKPGRHGAHAAAPATGLTDPGWHVVHDVEAAASENVPRGHDEHDTLAAEANEPDAQGRHADKPVTLLTVPAKQAKQAKEAGAPENVPAGHSAQAVPASICPTGQGVYDTDAFVSSATATPPDACTTMTWLLSGWLDGMAGSRQTICASVEALTRHLAEATNTLGLAGPNPTPKMASQSPPVRLHWAMAADAAGVPHPATPDTTGSAYDTALSSVADTDPDRTVKVNARPVPAGKANCTSDEAASTACTCVAAKLPTNTVSGTNRNWPRTVMVLPPALGHAVVCTTTPDESGPASSQPDRAVMAGVEGYEYVSVDCTTTSEAESHKSNGKLAVWAVAGASEKGAVTHTKYDVVSRPAWIAHGSITGEVND